MDFTELGIFVFLQPVSSVLVALSIIALQLFCESYMIFPLSTVIFSNSQQLPKAPIPIDVTELGMFTSVILAQPEKAKSPIVVNVFGIFIDVKLLQLKNAPSYIDVTEIGISTNVKLGIFS